MAHLCPISMHSGLHASRLDPTGTAHETPLQDIVRYRVRLRTHSSFGQKLWNFLECKTNLFAVICCLDACAWLSSRNSANGQDTFVRTLPYTDFTLREGLGRHLSIASDASTLELGSSQSSTRRAGKPLCALVASPGWVLSHSSRSPRRRCNSQGRPQAPKRWGELFT